jgi:hypothetical protein
MSYTYPQALNALESIAKDFIKVLRPHVHTHIMVKPDTHMGTASVSWDDGLGRATIYLPVRKATSTMTQSEFEDWTAYVLHELGHPTHTNRATWDTAVSKGLGMLTNALEDVRMEKALIASGKVLNAKAVLSRLISRKVVEARTTKWRPNSRKDIGWTICVLGRAANGYDIDAGDVAWIKSQIVPGSTVDQILAWAMPALAQCQNTADCLSLAEKIAAAIAVKPEQSDNSQRNGSNGQGNNSSKGEKGEGEGEGEDTKGEGEDSPQKGPQNASEGDTEEGANKGEGEGEDSDKPSSDAPSADSEGNGHGDGTTDDESPVTDQSQLNERSLAPDGEALSGSEAAVAKTVLDVLRSGDIGSTTNDYRFPRNKHSGAWLKTAAANASRQKALLARALRANETDEREGGRRAGRLDRGALSRAMAGSRNVFQRREMSDGYDTDVSILLDASGSMGGDMGLAMEAGLVIAQAASSVGAPCTTEVFNSKGYTRAGSLASKRAPVVADFSGLSTAAAGGTPLSFQMARAAIAQAKRAPNMRRVLFVVTDGSCDYGHATVKATADYLERTYGTIFAHVSIGSPLQGNFKAEVRVPRGQSFANIGLEHFVKVLRAL